MKRDLKEKALTESIYSIHGQESIDTNSKLFNLLVRARDEAHRFSLNAQRKKTNQTIKKSVLDDVPGIGKKRKLKLLNYFKSIKNLRESSVDEISSIPSISKILAKGFIKL